MKKIVYSDKKPLAFLKEYEKLCRKYNLAITGCGCCDSPCLEELNQEDVLGWTVDWKEKEVECIWFRNTEDDLYSPMLDTLYYITKDGKIEMIKDEDY